MAGADAIKFHRFYQSPRAEVDTLDPEVRRGCFDVVHLGFAGGPDGAGAVSEALRCLSCGVCNECDRCMEYCPEGVLRRSKSEDGYTFDLEYCKGCGVCMTACPRGAIYMTGL